MEKMTKGIISVLKSNNTRIKVEKVINDSLQNNFLQIHMNKYTEKALESEIPAAPEENVCAPPPAKTESGQQLEEVKSVVSDQAGDGVASPREGKNKWESYQSVVSALTGGDVKKKLEKKRGQSGSDEYGDSGEHEAKKSKTTEHRGQSTGEKVIIRNVLTKTALYSSFVHTVGTVAGLVHSVMTEGWATTVKLGLRKFALGDMSADINRLNMKFDNTDKKIDAIMRKIGVEDFEGFGGSGNGNGKNNGENSKKENGNGDDSDGDDD